MHQQRKAASKSHPLKLKRGSLAWGSTGCLEQSIPQPADTDNIDDDENYNLLARASSERLSGVPKITHQDISSYHKGRKATSVA
ncbi:hypothetical protein WJX79_009974 [Trebouxia sp. C0005]